MTCVVPNVNTPSTRNDPPGKFTWTWMSALGGFVTVTMERSLPTTAPFGFPNCALALRKIAALPIVSLR
jgi:hypothetical protein